MKAQFLRSIAHQISSSNKTALIASSLFAGWLLLVTQDACAQGLIWSLPEEGQSVHFQGEYIQEMFPINSDESESKIIKWIRDLTIKSAGRETAQYNGSEQPCRWIEFEVVTRPSDVEIQPGPGSSRIYKVLVPESRVIGKLKDGDEIAVSFMPIVKGTRRIGDKPAEPIKTKVLQVYPVISLLRHYERLESDSQGAMEVDIPFGIVNASKHKGSFSIESRTSRSINEAEFWRSNEVPFGLAKWTVNIVREQKQDSEARSEFKTVSKITVTMEAQRPE